MKIAIIDISKTLLNAFDFSQVVQSEVFAHFIELLNFGLAQFEGSRLLI